MTSGVPDEATERETVCVDCRTALWGEEACDGGRHHRVASLATAEGREVLLAEVWGPPSVRRRAIQLAKAGGAGAGVSTALESSAGGLDCTCGCLEAVGSAVELGSALAVIALVAGAFALIYWLVSKIVEVIRRRRNRLKPNGALRRPARPRVKGGRLRGRVVGGANRVSAPDGSTVLGFGLEVRCRRFLRSSLMLRDGAVGDLEVILDDGQTLQIPAGRARVEAKVRGRALKKALVEAYLSRLDPHREMDTEHTPIPFDEARLVEIAVDQRVEVHADVERVAIADKVGGHAYREAPPAVLVTQGIVSLRQLNTA